MRNKYTASVAACRRSSSIAAPSSRPRSIKCEHCGGEFGPSKDRKRFCSRPCFQQWERDRASEARALGIPLVQKSTPPAREDSQSLREETYADRCRHWIEETEAEYRIALGETGKRQNRPPLILTGHGISISVKGGALQVRDGLTHHPQERKELLIFPGRHNVPSRMVLLGESGSVTIDAMRWLSEQDVPLIVLNFLGEVVTSTLSRHSDPDHQVRQMQILCLRTDRSLQIAKWLISEKLKATIVNLNLFPDNKAKSEADRTIQSCLVGVERASTTSALFLLEATAAQAYFDQWQELPLRWTSTSLKAIPESWLSFGSRNSEVSGTNRHASHPVNAMLNYAYGVCEAQTLIACRSSGIDPTISYLHSLRPDRNNLVYDLMELLRLRVDRRVNLLLQKVTLSKSDFELSVNATCRLNPHIAAYLTSTVALEVNSQESAKTISLLISELRIRCQNP